MESDCNDTTMQQTINIETPHNHKSKRRSSVFRPEIILQNENVNNTEKFNMEYCDKLKQETVDWKICYVKIKEEYTQLRSGSNEIHLDNERFKEYGKALENKVKQFCLHVNNARNMHKHLLCYKKNLIEEHKNLAKITNTEIYEKLKFS
ncbi:hypothetical protein RN001_004476 [Aquatica leii]|uniref:Uncharacterized protein n=1 Tax=Aquatica leii TaxID=1421715 RepID=A0AAN7PAR3_9COLE|nr:hypothetical protein RN001_004476 [Aquatica leii]